MLGPVTRGIAVTFVRGVERRRCVVLGKQSIRPGDAFCCVLCSLRAEFCVMCCGGGDGVRGGGGR